MTHLPTTIALPVLQRCDRFVGRTMNWLYDHLRYVPRHESVVLSDKLENRDEFPLLEARARNGEYLPRRVWRSLMGERLYPTEVNWLRRCRPALLHSHFGYVALGDFGLRRLLDVPWVVSFYGADVYQQGSLPVWRKWYARLFAEVDLVLALGPQMAIQLESLGCPKEKTAVHPLGVDIDFLPSCPRVLQRGSPLRILFAGTFREKKGIEYLLQGAAKARKYGVRLHLTIVGEALDKPGDLATKESVLREINKLHLDEVVTLRPFLRFDDLVKLAIDSHIFVGPSVTSADGDTEGTPFVLQQMMATGMPVIATVHGDIPYIFGEHRSHLVPERDADAIAIRLQQYAAEPEQLVEVGMALKDRIRKVFDVRKCAAQLSDLYDAVKVGGRLPLKYSPDGDSRLAPSGSQAGTVGLQATRLPLIDD